MSRELRVPNDPVMRRVKRLRTVEGLTWQEIEERTGIPHSTAHAHLMGRTPLTKAERNRMARLRKQREEIRMLRARVRYLEIRVRELEQRAVQP